MANKKIVFVRGGDQTPDRPWRFYHFHPTLDQFPSDPVDLVYFDYVAGYQTTFVNWKPNRRRNHRPPIGGTRVPLKPLVRIRNVDMTIGQETISTLGLYSWVKDQPEKSIISFQWFGHGAV